MIRCFVDGIELRPSADEAHKQTEPVAHEITINFKAMPALFVKGLGAGACSEAFNKLLETTVVVLCLYYAGTRDRSPRVRCRFRCYSGMCQAHRRQSALIPTSSLIRRRVRVERPGIGA